MPKLTLKIKNHCSKKIRFSLFNVLYNSLNNIPIPKDVEITALVKNPKSKAFEVKYQDILVQIDIVPVMVNMLKSTNNRQLDFFKYDKRDLMFGGKTICELEPGLTIDRKPRPVKSVKRNYVDDDGCVQKWAENEYVKKWDPKEWNIADTKEVFILDNLVGVNINLLSLQEFELILNVHSKPELSQLMSKKTKKIK